MKKLMFYFSLVVFLLSLSSLASACQWAWTNPTTNTDGTPATDQVSTNLYLLAPGATTPSIEGTVAAPLSTLTLPGPCAKGRHWATAVNSFGVESENSNVVTIKQLKNPTSLSVGK